MNRVALFVVFSLFIAAQASVQLELQVTKLKPLLPKEAFQTFTEYAKALNYPVQEHKIVCADGYILTFFRIQAKNTQIVSGKQPILINHGLLDSADSFIINEESKAPGLIFANEGYDVWFTNNRGNKYSLEHTNPAYNSADSSNIFWEFSWQEMSLYDIPAAFDYIVKYTGQKVTYIGHSEGTTIMFAALARREPSVVNNLNKFIALAPAVFLQHSTSSLVQIGGWIEAGYLLDQWEAFWDSKKFGFMNKTWRILYVGGCSISQALCNTRAKLMSGVNKEYDNVERLPITSGHYPAGSSLQNIDYWSQMFNKPEFRMFDFGAAQNQVVYGSTTPPIIDLGRITEPVYMFVGTEDTLASLADTATLRGRLTGSAKVEYRTYHLGHSSFLYGRDTNTYVNDVLAVLRK